MAGYQGYSRSNNSAEAIENNEVPLSFFTKKFIERIIYEGEGVYDSLKGIPVKRWKEAALEVGAASWHHTSKFYNRTNHYDAMAIANFLLNPEDYYRKKREREDEKRSREKEEREEYFKRKELFKTKQKEFFFEAKEKIKSLGGKWITLLNFKPYTDDVCYFPNNDSFEIISQIYLILNKKPKYNLEYKIFEKTKKINAFQIEQEVYILPECFREDIIK